jgi:hypothetical protein
MDFYGISIVVIARFERFVTVSPTRTGESIAERVGHHESPRDIALAR